MKPELLYFGQLPAHIKPSARESVITAEREAAGRALKSAKSVFLSGIHQAVNNRSHIRVVVNHHNLIKRLSSELRYLDSFIEENLCMFSPQGDMYLFMQQRFATGKNNH